MPDKCRPSSLMYLVNWRARYCGASATNRLLIPRSVCIHATLPPVGAAEISEGKGALSNFSSVTVCAFAHGMSARIRKMKIRFIGDLCYPLSRGLNAKPQRCRAAKKDNSAAWRLRVLCVKEFSTVYVQG